MTVSKRALTFTFDEAADFCGVPRVFNYLDNWGNHSDFWGECYESAVRDLGMSDEKAQETATGMQMKAETRIWEEYIDAVEDAFSTLMGHLDLAVKRIYPKGGVGAFVVTPKRSWKDSAKEVVELINGVGYFEFPSVKALLDSGPYTPREAVIEHIGYAKDYSRIYGGPSAADQIERNMDRFFRYHF
jgi:hypothetical protein